VSEDRERERRYRRLLKWYPAEFRRENGEELVAVLMEFEGAGQRQPSMDLIKSGLWLRLRPRVPRTVVPAVRAAVVLMYAGALISALGFIATVPSLRYFADTNHLSLLGHRQSLPITIVAGLLLGLILTGAWMWMARAVGEGRRGARVLATVLVAPATLHLFGLKGLIAVVFAMVTWLIGLSAVWLLWRPASRAFFDRDVAALAPRPSEASRESN
jgi:hypothetical protein